MQEIQENLHTELMKVLKSAPHVVQSFTRFFWLSQKFCLYLQLVSTNPNETPKTNKLFITNLKHNAYEEKTFLFSRATRDDGRGGMGRGLYPDTDRKPGSDGL